jgi:hypothetical protein
VFDFFVRLAALPDGRCYGGHTATKIFEAVFFGSACQFGSLHRIETECRQGALRRRIGRVSEDAIGYTLERQDPPAIFALGCDIARQLKRNQVFASSWSRGLVVAAVDGIEICSSFVRCCSCCLERTVKYKVGEEQREHIQYYHRISLVSIVSGAFPIPLGIRFQQKGEDEVACSRALLEDLMGHLGRRFLDVLVTDALYLRASFVQKIEALGLDWVITLKANQPELLAEAERVAAALPPHPPCAQQDESLQLWYLPRLDWTAADRDVQVVKTLRQQSHRCQHVESAAVGEKHIRKIVATQTSTNFYASNLELGSIPPFFLHQLGRSRWDIDARLFQTLVTEGALKQPSLHQGYEKALVVLTMIRVLAFTLAQVFYYRQVRSHFRTARFGFCDQARLMAGQFLLIDVPDSS